MSLFVLPALIIIIAGLIGLVISLYIHYKKSAHKVLVCPIGSTCDTVVHSEYSRFFGIPLEYLGIAYYFLIVVGYATFLTFPELKISWMNVFTLTTSTAALLFSLYLTFIQAFILRQWCTWCLFSATMCGIIFVGAVAFSEFKFIPFFIAHKEILLGIHVFGAALGLGGATMADIFFFRFLKDFRITKQESATLHTMSQVIWFGLGILIISGIAVFFSDMARYMASSKFLLKTVVILVITINGTFLNLLVSPWLVKLSFYENQRPRYAPMHRMRRIAFALGAISATSWYLAFILGLVKRIPLSFPTLVLCYAGLLLCAVIGSQILERIYIKKALSEKVHKDSVL